MRIFKVDEEDWDKFGNISDEYNSFLTYDQLEKVAIKWETDIDDVIYYCEEITGWFCEECRYNGDPEIEAIRDGVDADGNRGWTVYNEICPKCKNDMEEI